MDFLKKNWLILLLSIYGFLFVQASSPGFEIKEGKGWVTDSVTYTEFDGEIINSSKLKVSKWHIEIPYNKKKNSLHGNWGCDIEVQDDKIILTGGSVNGVIKVSTTATFGFIVSDPDSKFDIESAVLFVNDKKIPVHSKPDDSNDDAVDINVGLPVEDNRYYLESMDIDKLKAAATALSVHEVKQIIFKELVEHWDIIRKYLRNDNMLKVFALFLGWATRESTLNAGVETAFEDGFGVNSAHAYGPFQTAVTAFYGCDPKFDLEDDVKEMYWYTLSDKNFCDPYISTHMGIRKLIHFVFEAENFGVTGIDIIRSSLKGFNSGHADPMRDNSFQGYCDEIGALGHWYYETGHFEDDVYTWTGDDRCDRKDPWSWWLKDDPLPEVKIPVYVRNPVDGTTTKYTVDTYPKASIGTTTPSVTTTTKNKPTSNSNKCWAKDLGYSCCKGCNIVSTDELGSWGVENNEWCGIVNENCKKTSAPSKTTTAKSKPTTNNNKCWAKDLGYSCCKGCEIVSTDELGSWGVENNEWCGIVNEKCKGNNAKSTCFTEKKNLGFPCCDTCDIVFTDDDGNWGVKNNNWCGIPDKCN